MPSQAMPPISQRVLASKFQPLGLTPSKRKMMASLAGIKDSNRMAPAAPARVMAALPTCTLTSEMGDCRGQPLKRPRLLGSFEPKPSVGFMGSKAKVQMLSKALGWAEGFSAMTVNSKGRPAGQGACKRSTSPCQVLFSDTVNVTEQTMDWHSQAAPGPVKGIAPPTPHETGQAKRGPKKAKFTGMVSTMRFSASMAMPNARDILVSAAPEDRNTLFTFKILRLRFPGETTGVVMTFPSPRPPSIAVDNTMMGSCGVSMRSSGVKMSASSVYSADALMFQSGRAKEMLSVRPVALHDESTGTNCTGLTVSSALIRCPVNKLLEQSSW
mmetsp:Transcript_76623/g.164310  ORF Transcript_76623/g.164310 Transcript_76623/m.164310 type:complete len:327 (+) Transcript_76623:2640-3620(+)